MKADNGATYSEKEVVQEMTVEVLRYQEEIRRTSFFPTHKQLNVQVRIDPVE